MLYKSSLFIQIMRSHTPTSRKSPFSINRKSQIPGTSSFILNKENSQSNFNKFIENTCQLSKSRPILEIDGNLVGASSIFKQKESMLTEHKNTSRKLELQLAKKNQALSDLSLLLEQKDDLINRLEAQKQSMGDAFALMQAETLKTSNLNQALASENMSLKRQLNQKTTEFHSASSQIEQLKSNLEVYHSLDPRLKQLQELQDRLIEQNSHLKQEKDRYCKELKAAIKSMKTSKKLDFKELEALLNSL